MSAQKKGAANTYGTTPHQQDSVCKGTNFPTRIQEVQALFLSGSELTAKDINELIGGQFTDARKAISVLRLAPYKMQIKDRRAAGHRHKIYWLETKNKTYQQPSLFPVVNCQGSTDDEPQQAHEEPQQGGGMAEAKSKKGGVV